MKGGIYVFSHVFAEYKIISDTNNILHKNGNCCDIKL